MVRNKRIKKQQKQIWSESTPSSHHQHKPSEIKESAAILTNSELFKGKDVLVLGSKEGTLSFEILIKTKPKRVTNIERDAVRVLRSVKNSKHLENIEQKDITHLQQIGLKSFRKDPLSAALVALAGEDIEADWLYNKFFFFRSDAYDYLTKITARFDTIILNRSLFKKMHLERGDKGLETFIKNISTRLNSKGHLILDIYQKSSYVKTTKKDKEYKGSMKGLKLEEEGLIKMISKYLYINKNLTKKETGAKSKTYVFQQKN